MTHARTALPAPAHPELSVILAAWRLGDCQGAIDAFTLGLGRELATEGIRVNAVRPGIIETEIHADSGDAQRPYKSAAVIPMQRPGTALEVAEAIVWLLEPGASYVTGSVVSVTGGR